MKLLLLVALGFVLAGCREEPQLLRQSSEAAAASDQKQTGRRERTLGQNESSRIYR